MAEHECGFERIHPLLIGLHYPGDQLHALMTAVVDEHENVPVHHRDEVAVREALLVLPHDDDGVGTNLKTIF